MVRNEFLSAENSSKNPKVLDIFKMLDEKPDTMPRFSRGGWKSFQERSAAIEKNVNEKTEHEAAEEADRFANPEKLKSYLKRIRGGVFTGGLSAYLAEGSYSSEDLLQDIQNTNDDIRVVEGKILAEKNRSQKKKFERSLELLESHRRWLERRLGRRVKEEAKIVEENTRLDAADGDEIA